MSKKAGTLLLLTLAVNGHTAEQLAELVVTATGYQVPLKEALASVEIISGEEIERASATDLGDLLKFQNGLELGRNGGPGQTASLFIRGTESNHNLVLINGVKINSGSVGSAAIQHIDPQLIERIEIVRGPRSTLWGSGAIGGVVNVITRDQADVTGGAGGSMELGGENTRRGNAYLSHGQGNWYGNIGLSHERTDGFPSSEYSTIDRGYQNTSFNFGGNVTLDHNAFHLSHWQTSGNNEYLDFALNPVDQDFLNSSTIATWTTPVNDWWNSDLRASYVRDEIEQRQSVQSVKTGRTTLEWRNDLFLPNRQRLAAGALITGEDVDAEGGFAPYAEDTEYHELYLHYDRAYEQHQLIAGLRYIKHSDAGTHYVWNLDYGFDFSPRTHLFASAGTGFRYPTADERFGFAGNPQLKPEESTSFELGLSHQLSDNQDIRVSLYRTEIDNLIQWVLTEPPFTGYNQNIDSSRIDGLEASWQLTHDAWTIELGGMLQDPRDQTDGSRLLRRARYSLNSRLSYAAGNWTLSANLLHSGDRVDFGDVGLDSYTLINFYAGYQLDRRWNLYGKVENLLDEEYQLADGFNTQGRIAYIGLRFN